MKKLFISLPMLGRTDDVIKSEMKDIYARVCEMFPDESIKLIDSMIHEVPPADVNIPACYLSESIRKLAEADLVYFADGWEKARGCSIENTIAHKYSIGIIIHE